MTLSKSDLNDWDSWIEELQTSGYGAPIAMGTVTVGKVKDLVDEIRRLQAELKKWQENVWPTGNLLVQGSKFDDLSRWLELGKAVEEKREEKEWHAGWKINDNK